VLVERTVETYTSDNTYPDTLYEVAGVNAFRGFTILYMTLYPVQYQPKSGVVHFYETLTVTVTLKKGVVNQLYRGLPEDFHDVITMVDNPEVVQPYEHVKDFAQPLQATEEYIITNYALSDTFQVHLFFVSPLFLNHSSLTRTTMSAESFPVFT
jgi:hypothetical protein